MIPRFYNLALGNDSTAWKRLPGAEKKRRVPTPQRVAAASTYPRPEGLFGAVGSSGRKC